MYVPHETDPRSIELACFLLLTSGARPTSEQKRVGEGEEDAAALPNAAATLRYSYFSSANVAELLSSLRNIKSERI